MIGSVRKQLEQVVKAELLDKYIGSATLSGGTWLLLSVVRQVLACKTVSLVLRVFRTKLLTASLPTGFTKRRRNQVLADDDVHCRLCGLCLETD